MLAIEPGAEWCLPLAKKALRVLHDELVRMGLSVRNQRIPFPTGEVIFVQAHRLMMPDGCAPAFIDTIRITAGGQSYLVGVSMPDPTPYRNLFLETLTSSNQLQVTMSDGTVLATQAQSAGSPTFSGAWLGEEGTLISTGNLPFAVPADTQSSLTGATALAREKARLQTNSTAAIGMLRGGVLPKLGFNGWARSVKNSVLNSILPREISAFTAALSGPEVLGPLFLGTPFTEFDVTVTRSVTVQYTDANGVLQQETITGTWRQQEIKHSKASAINFFSYTNVFANFPAFFLNGTFGMVTTFLDSNTDVGAYRDSFGGSLGVVLDGQTINVSDSSGFASDQNNDSSYSAPTDPTRFYGYSPAVPSLTLNTTARVVDLYKQYLRDIKPVDVSTLPDPKPAYSSNWLSTSMVPGEVVSLIPFGPVKDSEDLGMFGSHTGAQQVALYGVASFKYDVDGSFTFVSWRDGIPAAPATATAPAVVAGPKMLDMLDSAGAAITWPGTNCIVKFTKFGWTDTKATAAAQAKLLTAPVTNADKFLKLIKSAAGI